MILFSGIWFSLCSFEATVSSFCWLWNLQKLKFWGGGQSKRFCLGAWKLLLTQGSKVSLFSCCLPALNGGCAEPVRAHLSTLKWPFLLYISLSFFHIKQCENILSSDVQNHAEDNGNAEPFVLQGLKHVCKKQPQQFRLQYIHIYK